MLNIKPIWLIIETSVIMLGTTSEVMLVERDEFSGPEGYTTIGGNYDLGCVNRTVFINAICKDAPHHPMNSNQFSTPPAK